MDQWEYLTVPLMRNGELWDATYFSQQLHPYGLQGWELVSCFTVQSMVRFYASFQSGTTTGVFAMFKRKKST